MSLQSRLSKLEQETAPAQKVKQWKYVTQDKQDPDLFHDNDGNAYTRGELATLGDDYRLIMVLWPGHKDD